MWNIRMSARLAVRRRRSAIGTRAGACTPLLIVAIGCVTGCGSGAGEAHVTVTATAPVRSVTRSSGPITAAPSPGASSTPAASSAPAASSPSTAAAAATGTIAAADAICSRRNGELAAISGPASAGAVGSAESRRVAVERRALDELAKLEPPRSGALSYRRVLVYSQVMLKRAEALSAPVAATDAHGSPLAKAPIKGQMRLLAAASRAGMRDCYPVD